MTKLPSYNELPVVDGAPKGSSWGLWGPDDVLGCLNLLTEEKRLAAAQTVTRGTVFPLSLEMEVPDPPLYRRESFQHVVKNTVVNGLAIGHDDRLDSWNTQSSSQWDGFRHMSHPAWGYYNGIADGEHGMHHWAKHGIVGRAVLADVARWREGQGNPVKPGTPEQIPFSDVLATLESQGSPVETGDILLIRTGWLSWYRQLDQQQRSDYAAGGVVSCGLARGVDTLRGLWDLHPSAVALDNPGMEVMPVGNYDSTVLSAWHSDPEAAADAMLHFCLLGLLGLPIGELFDLDPLAEDCVSDGRYACMLTSAPLNVRAGVASPPNALAIK